MLHLHLQLLALLIRLVLVLVLMLVLVLVLVLVLLLLLLLLLPLPLLPDRICVAVACLLDFPSKYHLGTTAQGSSLGTFWPGSSLRDNDDQLLRDASMRGKLCV
jgi:hypothetical protein